MTDLDPVKPVRRYERATPGELIHIDIKKLRRIDGVGHRITADRRGPSNRRGRGQGLGWEFAYVGGDDTCIIPPGVSFQEGIHPARSRAS